MTEEDFKLGYHFGEYWYWAKRSGNEERSVDKMEDEETIRCEHCEGYGEIRTSSDMGADWLITCQKCGGTGVKESDSKEAE